MVEQTAVTATERRCCTLNRIDYEDAFLLEADPEDSRTAEQWARSMLEGAPHPLQRRLRTAWLALGLRLGPDDPSPTAVLGWPIHQQSPNMLLLRAESRFGMTGELLFLIDGGTLVFATFIHYRNPALRAIWTKIAPQHLLIVRHLLQRAPAEQGPWFGSLSGGTVPRATNDSQVASLQQPWLRAP